MLLATRLLTFLCYVCTSQTIFQSGALSSLALDGSAMSAKDVEVRWLSAKTAQLRRARTSELDRTCRAMRIEHTLPNLTILPWTRRPSTHSSGGWPLTASATMPLAHPLRCTGNNAADKAPNHPLPLHQQNLRLERAHGKKSRLLLKAHGSNAPMPFPKTRQTSSRSTLWSLQMHCEVEQRGQSG